MSDEIEVEFEDSRKGIKLKVKGKQDVVDAYIEKYGYASAMKEAIARGTQGENLEDESKISIDDIPEKPKFAKDEGITLTKYITALMYSKWGNSGRTSSELLEVAKIHGLSLGISSLSGILFGLIKSGKLRRTKEAGGQWKYYPPTAISMKL